MLHAVLGIVDRPFEQRRDPLWVDLSGSAGHAAVAGAPRSGKSTVLLTLISSLALLHTPAQVQFYILDFGGGSMGALGGLPHVGGVASRLQGDRVRRTVAEVRTLLDQREREFSERGIDSIATYRRLRAEGAIAGDGFGDVFLVVDGWLTLRQDYEDLEQTVTALAARGLGYGVHLVAATNKWSEFRPAVRDLFGTRLELRLGDPYESEIGRAAAGNVPSGAPGRGLTRDGLHFLTAMPRVDGQATAAGLPEAIRSLAARAAAAWPGSGAPPVRMLPDVLPAAELPPPASTGTRVPFGIDENSLAPVFLDFTADPHFLVLGDTECGKSNLLRLAAGGIAARFTPGQAKVIFLDYRRSLLDAAQIPHQIGYATSSVAAATLLEEVRGALNTRLPPPDLTPDQLRSRSWWSGSDLFLIVDDYDLVAGTQNPLLALAEFLPQARDVGLHVILARSAGGAGRAMFDPVIQRLREMGSPGLIMSGSKDEGALLGGVRPARPAVRARVPGGPAERIAPDPGRPARRGRPGGVPLGAVPHHRPAVTAPPPLGPPGRQWRRRPAGMARAAAVTRTASPAAPATTEKATVRAARSGAAARMIRTRPAGPAAWAPPPWTFPLPGEVPSPWPLTWAPAARRQRGGREHGRHRLDRVDHAAAGSWAGRAVRGGGDPGHYLSLVQVRVVGPDQRGDPGYERRREAGAVVAGVVGRREGSGVGTGHVDPRRGDADRRPGVGETGQRAVRPDRADREHPGVGRRVERPGGAPGAVIAGRRDDHHVAGLRELHRRLQGRGADGGGQRQVDHVRPEVHRIADRLGRHLAGEGVRVRDFNGEDGRLRGDTGERDARQRGGRDDAGHRRAVAHAIRAGRRAERRPGQIRAPPSPGRRTAGWRPRRCPPRRP